MHLVFLGNTTEVKSSLASANFRHGFDMRRPAELIDHEKARDFIAALSENPRIPGKSHRIAADPGQPLDLAPGTKHDDDHIASVVSCATCGQSWDIDVRALRRPPERSRIARVSERIDAGAAAAVLPGSVW